MEKQGIFVVFFNTISKQMLWPFKDFGTLFNTQSFFI